MSPAGRQRIVEVVRAAYWEEKLRQWSAPPSQAEKNRRDRTEQLVRDAIRKNSDLPPTVEVFAKGSSANNTNVRLDSDVDVGVKWTATGYYDLAFGAEDVGAQALGITPASRPVDPDEFKDAVGQALLDEFGSRAVARGDKAFTVRESSIRLAADVVPCFDHTRYDGPSGRPNHGICIWPDGGGRILNWPAQNLRNGRNKNNRTSRRYKSMVRALKRLENVMVENGESPEVHSYLIECLVWNVPDEGFGHSTYLADMRYVLAHLFNSTLTDDECHEWGEVNELKYLFRSSQRWTRTEAHEFLSLAWDHMDLE
jgi:hypothetical protein